MITDNLTFYMRPNGSLTLAGALLLHDYYKNKPNASKSPFFVLNSVADLVPLICVMPKKGIYGVIFRHIKSTHMTPLVIKDATEVIVLDSLGVRGNAYAMETKTQLNDVFKMLGMVPHSIMVDHQRQSSPLGCSSEAFLVLKEALRLGEELFRFYQKESEQNVPAQIAKYTEAVRRLLRYKNDDKKGLYDNFPDFIDSPIRVNRSDNLKTETAMTYVYRHSNATRHWNKALEDRMLKHRNVLQRMLLENKSEQIVVIMQDASAINLIKEHPEQLQAMFQTDEHYEELMNLLGIKENMPELTGGKNDLSGNKELLSKTIIYVEREIELIEQNFLSNGQDLSLMKLAKLVYGKYYLTNLLDNKPMPVFRVPSAKDEQQNNLPTLQPSNQQDLSIRSQNDEISCPLFDTDNGDFLSMQF